MASTTSRSRAVPLKESYDIVCPFCGENLWCRPSIFHHMGAHHLGGGYCLTCRKSFEIHYQPETDSMQAMKGDWA